MSISFKVTFAKAFNPPLVSQSGNLKTLGVTKIAIIDKNGENVNYIAELRNMFLREGKNSNTGETFYQLEQRSYPDSKGKINPNTGEVYRDINAVVFPRYFPENGELPEKLGDRPDSQNESYQKLMQHVLAKVEEDLKNAPVREPQPAPQPVPDDDDFAL